MTQMTRIRGLIRDIRAIRVGFLKLLSLADCTKISRGLTRIHTDKKQNPCQSMLIRGQKPLIKFSEIEGS